MEHEIVFRAKLNDHPRPGGAMSPRLLHDYSRFSIPLFDTYCKHCSQFDDEEVYGAVFSCETHKHQHEIIRNDGYRQFQKFGKAIAINARHHGGWIACVDLEKYYEWLTADFVFDALQKFNVRPDVIDGICKVILRNGRGLPQGFATSDLIARIVLTPFDREMIDRGIPFVRFVDDIRVPAESDVEAHRRLHQTVEILHKHNLNVNFKKSRVNPIERLNWLIQNVIWHVPVEEFYYDEYESNQSFTTECYSGGNCASIDEISQLDWVQLYRDYFSPGKRIQTENEFRRVIREIGRIDSKLLLAETAKLVSERQVSVPSVLYAIGNDSLRRAAHICRSQLNCGDHRFDSSLVCMEIISKRQDTEFASEMARRALSTEVRVPDYFLRGAVDLLDHCEENLLVATDRLADRPIEADTAASVAALAHDVGGNACRFAKLFIEKERRGLGILFELAKAM